MVELKYTSKGDVVKPLRIMALFIEAASLGCPLTDLVLAENPVENWEAVDINRVVEWLITNHPDKYTIGG